MLNIKVNFKRYINLLVPLLGITLIVIMLVLVWYWETKGREIYFYKDVLILNQDIQGGTIITKEVISVEKLEANKIIDHGIQNPKDIIGLEAKHFIPKQSQLHPLFFESPDITLGNGEYLFRLPNEWIFSIPNTLRRKDKVKLFLFKNKLEVKEITTQNGAIQTYSGREELNEKLKQLLFETRVIYVKDSVNREVVSVSDDDRLDGSSVISEVIISITSEQLLKLQDAASNNYKIILVYSEGVNL